MRPKMCFFETSKWINSGKITPSAMVLERLDLPAAGHLPNGRDESIQVDKYFHDTLFAF